MFKLSCEQIRATALTLFLAAQGCAPIKPIDTKLSAIIGRDDRTSVSEVQLQAAVGALAGPGGPICTAFAIAPQIVVTAAHCFDPTATSNTYRFVTTTENVAIQNINRLADDADVVFLNLSQTVHTYFETTDMTTAGSHGGQIVSFEIAQLQLVTSSHGEWHSAGKANGGDGIVLHTFDTVPGASGSPLLYNQKVVGVHIGFSPKRNKNVAVGLPLQSSTDVKRAIPDYQTESPAVAEVIRKGAEMCMALPACRGVVEKHLTDLVDRSLKFVVDAVTRLFEYVLDRKTASGEGHPIVNQTRREYNDSAKDVREGRPENRREWREPRGRHDVALTNPSATSRTIAAAYIGYHINELYRTQHGVDAPEHIYREAIDHIGRGASFGWLKAWIRGFPVFEKIGNNGSVSCNQYCGNPRWGGEAGSCHSTSFSRGGLSCDVAPGLLRDGESLTCNCLRDSFEKHGNNGTVSCAAFCSGSQWGRVGMCLSGALSASGQSISCDEVAANTQGRLLAVSCMCAAN